MTTGSFPTTQPSCPGGTMATSPALVSPSVPSSMSTCNVPDTWYWKCGASQLFVFAIGFTWVDHRHPGWNTARPTVAPPTFTSSILPFSKVLVSSGVFVLLTSNLLNVHQSARTKGSLQEETASLQNRRRDLIHERKRVDRGFLT
jgi:hypothetical protein